MVEWQGRVSRVLVRWRHSTLALFPVRAQRDYLSGDRKMASLLCRGFGQVARRTALVSSARSCFGAPPVDPMKGKAGEGILFQFQVLIDRHW